MPVRAARSGALRPAPPRQMRSDLATVPLASRPSTIADAMLPAPRKANLGIAAFARLLLERMKQDDTRPAAFAIIEHHFAIQVAEGVTRDRQTHAHAHRVLGTDKGLENPVADLRIDPVSVI